jgi:hypothetical protein
LRAPRRRARVALALGVVALPLTPLAPAAISNAGAVTPTAFSGTAAADGVRITLTIPGAPLSDQLIDLGGPTAQATLDTLGTSTGYAALPDPGSLLNSAPGLLTGLLGQGFAGLPPIKLGPLPSYPVEITSDVDENPNVTGGAGPYQITATSTTTKSTATALGGLQSGLSGDIALLDSTSTVASAPDGTVAATATSTMHGLAVGPLAIGEVLSSASETMAADGTVTPASSLHINGVRIGGIAVALDAGELDVAGTKVPLPVGSTLTSLLAGAHISVKVLPAHTYRHRVVAPALQITMPLKTSIGSGNGTIRLVVGATTAALKVAGVTAGPGDVEPTSVAMPGIPTTGGLGDVPPITSPVSSLPGDGVATVPPTTVAPPTVAAANSAGLLDLFDIKSLYLALAGLGVFAFVLSQLVRLLGVRDK